MATSCLQPAAAMAPYREYLSKRDLGLDTVPVGVEMQPFEVRHLRSRNDHENCEPCSNRVLLWVAGDPWWAI